MSQSVHAVNAGSLAEHVVDEAMVLFWRVQVADEQKPHVGSHTLRSMNLGRFWWASVWSKLHDALKHFVKRAPEVQLDVVGAKALSSNHVPGEECQQIEPSNVIRAIFKDHLRNLGVRSEAAHLGHESIPVNQQCPILMA